MPNPQRVLVLLAVMLVVSLIAIVVTPFALVQARGPVFRDAIALKFSNTLRKQVIAEAARPFAPAIDSTLTPMVAGELMHALRGEQHRTAGVFQFRTDVEPVEASWKSVPYDPALFPSDKGSGWHGASPLTILPTVAAGTTPEQRAYLDRIASDPVWRVWDRIGTAAAIDGIGGQFVLPFTEEATWYMMPIPKFAYTKEIAYASVSRAAAHLAAGRRDSAEHALRATIGFGLAMSDNANTLIEQLIGVVIVGIGRDALAQLFTITNDPRGAVLTARVDSLTRIAEDSTKVATVLDARAYRGLGIERAQVLTFSPCTNVRELARGLNADHQAQFDSLRTAIARYPSEQALFDLIAASPLRVDDAWYAGQKARADLGTRFLFGMANIAGKIIGNPRVAPCTFAVMTL